MMRVNMLGFPVHASGVGLLRFGDECVVCDREGKPLCELNETGAAVWELCDGATAPLEMVQAVVDLCGLDSLVVKADIDRALDDFTLAGIISWRGADQA
jgi:hypothetical protein